MTSVRLKDPAPEGVGENRRAHGGPSIHELGGGGGGG